MTSSAPGEALSREHGSALTIPRIGDLRPYLWLALLTSLALTVAYAARPVVRIDLGGDHDAVFLRGFHGREIDAIGTPEQVAWPPDARVLSVPGHREGVWIATLRAAPGQPLEALRQAAVAVNGERVDMPRRGPDFIIAKVPAPLGVAETLNFSLVGPLVGDPDPPPGLVGEVELAPARTYRWSGEEASITLPNLGRGAWTLDLAMVTAHPDGQPVNAEVFVNDTLLARLPDSPAPRRVHLLAPASLVRDGTLEITLRSNTYADPRPLGVLVSQVTVAPAGNAGLATVVPPLGGLGLALVTVLGAFATLHLIVGGRPEGRRRAPPYLWAALGVGLAALLGAWALMAHRFPSSFMLPRLAWLALWSVALALALRPLTAWLFRAAGFPLNTPAADAVSGRSFLSLLLLFVMVSYWLKAIGALHPFFVAIDVNWHMTRAQWILEGRLPLLYGTSSPLNETTMPTAEWGENRPVIPYSPWFHMFATVFAFTPMSMDMAANMFSILIDSTRIVLIALIALKAGLTRRGALIAGATYAALPVAFLLHSWGNIPTTFGLWLTLVCNTIIFVWWERLGERRVMVTLSVLLLITFLMYTVTGVFMGLFLVILTLLVWLNGLRGGAWAALRTQLIPLWIAAGVAMALAVVIYYGQYIPLIIAQTVPYMKTVFTQGPESVGVVRPPFGQYMWSYVPHLDYRIWPGDYLYYGIAVPMLFTIPGFFALRRAPLPWLLFAAWLSVATLFMFAGYRISMVDKQLFYMLPVMCVCWAIYADRIWERWAWGRWVVIAVLLYTLYAALDQWVLRIATSPVVG
ncbi:MAG: hypothetical protein RMK84_09850 [Oscillochloridaceae bacterium]|nr:hypothetical protein [Chloroflexaceae bacterium]MDW8390416.1 hypothetical protein [Oscillochloridaceae bacterium]